MPVTRPVTSLRAQVPSAGNHGLAPLSIRRPCRTQPAIGSIIWDVANSHPDVSISADGLTYTHAASDSTDRMARASVSRSTGKWYFEITINAITTNGTVGVDGGTGTLADYVGDEANSLGWQQSGNALNHFGVKDTYTTWTSGDTLGIAWDGSKAYFSKISGGAHNWQGTGTDPATGAGGLTPDTALTNAFPAIDLVKVGDNATANFGASAFAAPIPAGFSSWDGTQTAGAGFYSMVAASGAFALAGSTVALKAGRTLAAASGGFVLAGSAMTPRVTMPAASASFIVAGTAVALKVGRQLSAASASFVLSGTAVSLRKGFSMPAASAAFALSGTAVSLRAARRLSAASGAFVLAGSGVGLVKGFRFTAASGAFTLTGKAAALLRGLRLGAASGAFVLTGSSAGLLKGRNMAAAAGAFTLGGSAAGFAMARRLSAASAAFVLTGPAVALIKGGPRMIAAAGTFALAGSGALFRYSRRMPAGAGVFALGGGLANLSRARIFTAQPRHFTFYGYPIRISLAALPFFPDNAPASIGLSVPPVRLPVEVTAAALPTPIGVAGAAAVPPPQAFTAEAVPAPPVSWES
jgi:hypothetical protein